MRLTFGAKILLALVGTVVLLLGTSLLAVRHQVRAQVEVLVDDTVERAGRVLAEVEQLRAQELERIGRRFTRSIRFAAAMDDALFHDDPVPLVEAAEYELQLAGYTPALLLFRDLAGVPLVRIRDGAVEMDHLGPDEWVDADLCAFETPETGYLPHDGVLHTVQHCLLELGRQPLGTLTVGLPLDDAVARQIGDVVGAELCFRMEGACVAGSLDAAAGEDGTRWAEVSRPLPGGPGDAELLLAVPLDALLGPFDRILRAERLAGGGALVLALLLGLVLARGLTGPVKTLVRATERVRRGEFDFRVEVESRDEMGDLADAFNGMLHDLALKERYRGVLDKVVSKDVAEEMLKGEIRLGGETRRVTVLFADIRGFTALTEGLRSEEVIEMLNAWCDGAAEAVEGAGGVVDKFLGDGLMAIFGAPIPHTDHAARGLRAALGIQEATARLNAGRIGDGLPPLAVGIGVATGEVAAGNSGSRTRLNYTVLGETVNLAARLCGEAEGGEILAGVHSWEEAQGGEGEGATPFTGEPAPARRVKGLSYEIRPWRVLAALLLLAPGALTPSSAEAQLWPPDPPTLAELGVEYISPTGRVQLLTSGRLELEAFAPGAEEPWLIPETSPFLAGRLRLFLDAFVGDRIMATAELRADRGQAPSAGDLQARLQQVFVRVGLDREGALALQVGQFVGPFGGYPSRARSPADPFLRPPLLYDYRTVACAGIAPASTEGFLTWKDRPDEFRSKGAPVVWDVPYPTGALLVGEGHLPGVGAVTARIGVVNSAPSAEPRLWRLDTSRRGAANLVGRVSARIVPELELGVSHSRGAWLNPEVEGFGDPDGVGPSGSSPRTSDYDQILWGVDAHWARGRFEVRGEVVRDLWEVPNVPYDVRDTSWFLETRMRTGAGGWVAGRIGEIRFNSLPTPGGEYERWDYDVRRLQLAAGYRLSRTVDVRAEYMVNRIAEGPREGGNLLSARVGWTF